MGDFLQELLFLTQENRFDLGSMDRRGSPMEANLWLEIYQLKRICLKATLCIIKRYIFDKVYIPPSLYFHSDCPRHFFPWVTDCNCRWDDKQSPIFYEICRFITESTRTCHWFLSSAVNIQCRASHAGSARLVIILSSRPVLSVQFSLLKICVSCNSRACYITRPVFTPWLDHSNNSKVKIMNYEASSYILSESSSSVGQNIFFNTCWYPQSVFSRYGETHIKQQTELCFCLSQCLVFKCEVRNKEESELKNSLNLFRS